MTEHDANDTDRRTFLKSTAAVTAAIPALSGIGAASEESGTEYELIEVGAGETYTKRLTDGEVWENVLIDITAEGAEYLISTNGASNWTIRNIGIRGTWDDSRSTSPFLAWEPDPNATSYIENVYLGDRQDIGYWLQRREEYGTTAGVTGISGTPSHAGHLEITNCHVRDYGDNCIRFDMPGNTGEHGTASGAGGTVAVRDTFAGGTGGGAIRTGTEPGKQCVIENCIATGQEDMDPATGRAVWAFHGNTVIRDCDFHSGSPLVRVGSSSWSTSAHIELENTRIEGGNVTTAGDASYSGSSAGDPERTEPEDMEGLIPLSAEEAASGERSESGTTTPPTDDDEDETEDETEGESIEDVWEDDEPNHVELSGGSASEVAEYRIAGYGDAEVGEYADTNEDDPYRDAATTDSEEFVVEGYLGGYVDDFYISGAVSEVETNVGLTATVNGQEFDIADLEGVGSWNSDETDDSEDDETDDSEAGDDNEDESTDEEQTNQTLAEFFSDWDNVRVCTRSR